MEQVKYSKAHVLHSLAQYTQTAATDSKLMSKLLRELEMVEKNGACRALVHSFFVSVAV